MGNFILIFVYLFQDWLCKGEIYSITTSKLLNKIVINFASGFSSFLYSKIHWNNQLLYPIGAAWIGFELLFYSFIF
jgi:hypothetical protein